MVDPRPLFPATHVKRSRLPAILLTLVGLAVLAATPAGEASGPGLFVAVGYGGFRGWSVDGVTWTAERWSAKNQDDDNIIFSLAWRAGIFLCSGGGAAKGFILRSTDGKRWDEVAKSRWRIHDVIAIDERFLAVFDGSFQTSPDGLAWTPGAEARTTAADVKGHGFFRRHAEGNGAVAFAGDYELGASKPRVGWIGGTRNGTTALTVTTTASDVSGLAFGNGRFVACTKDGAVLTSTDGLAFAAADTSGDRHDDGCLRFHQGRFVLRGKAGTRTSPDGAQWTPSPALHIARAIAPGGAAVDFSWGGIQVAADGATWRKAVVPIDPTGICDVVYGVPLAALPVDKRQ